MNTQVLATIVQEGGKLISSLLQTYAMPRGRPSPTQEDVAPRPAGLSTEETVNYQRRELAKQLTLLESHLQQGCKINGKPCDCCAKHPITIEGLAEEAKGMNRDPVFSRIADWSRNIAPITTQAAAESGKYEQKYQDLAIEARDLRKAVMPVEVSREEGN